MNKIITTASELVPRRMEDGLSRSRRLFRRGRHRDPGKHRHQLQAGYLLPVSMQRECAFETASGASISRARAFRVFKHVGMNVAAETGERLGSSRTENIVLPWSPVKALQPDGVDRKALVKKHVPPRAVAMNLKAYRAGYAM